MLDIFSRVHIAASQSLGHEASEKQADAGNYRKGAVDIGGLKVVIEQARNTYRTGTDKNGTQWATRLAADYGYFAGTTGADGDGVDCFVGSFPEAEHVYVINQHINGLFDEHKVMLGFLSLDDAQKAYEYSYDKGWQGLRQIIPCTFVQFKWWLKFGNKTKPITLESLPFDSESENTMNDTFNWNVADQNETASKAIYEMRRTDEGEELLEAATLDSVMDSVVDEGGEIEEEAVMDALVIKQAHLERKAKLLGAIFNRATGEVKVAENGVVITKPFKQMGSTQVAIMFEMTDGQTITVFLHNPDLKPNQLQPDDALISWKWLLNRKDITIVVAKENGKDLVPQVAATRVMALVNKNSARFTKANARRAERLVGITNLEKEVTDKTERLNALVKEIEVLETEQNQPLSTSTEEPKEEKTPPVTIPKPAIEPVQEGVEAVVDPVESAEPEQPVDEVPAVEPTEPDTADKPSSNVEPILEPETKEKHYSDVIFECLEKLGWKLKPSDDGISLYSHASKVYEGVQIGGELNPNGDIEIIARFDERARYLSAYKGGEQFVQEDGRDAVPEELAAKFDERVSGLMGTLRLNREGRSMKDGFQDLTKEFALLKTFMSPIQLSILNRNIKGEEGSFFVDKIKELVATFESMPKTRETDGQGNAAIVYLHYFIGGMDWYITEKDMEPEQLQAFGLADFGQGGELGYINIEELKKNNVELDFYWTPKSIGQIKGIETDEPENTVPVNGGSEETQSTVPETTTEPVIEPKTEPVPELSPEPVETTQEPSTEPESLPDTEPLETETTTESEAEASTKEPSGNEVFLQSIIEGPINTEDTSLFEKLETVALACQGTDLEALAEQAVNAYVLAMTSAVVPE